MISNLWRKQFLLPWNLFLPNSCKLKLYVIDFRFCPCWPPTSRLWIAWDRTYLKYHAVTVNWHWGLVAPCRVTAKCDYMAHIESLELWAQQWRAGSDLGNWYFSQDGTILLYHPASKVITRVSVSDLKSFNLPASLIGLQVSRWDCRMLNEFICFEYQILTVIELRNVRYYQCGVEREEIRRSVIRRHCKQSGRRKVAVLLGM